MYGIHLSEDGMSHETPNNTHDIEPLKPCTDYKHRVEYFSIDDKWKACEFINGNPLTSTKDISTDDITFDRCTRGCLSLSTGWNITSSLKLPPNAIFDQCNNRLCIRPAYNDICSNFTTYLTCRNNSHNLTEFISSDFLSGFADLNSIQQKVSYKLPANITTVLPPKCSNLTVDYSCLEGKNPTNVSDLEPFTNYSCTGCIRENDVIRANLSTIFVRVDCDLKIRSVVSDIKENAIEMTWRTTSENCTDIISQLDHLSYECKCVFQTSNKVQGVGMAGKLNETHVGCAVRNLNPYTKYYCDIQPKYRDSKVGQANKHDIETKIGVPEDTTDKDITFPENNIIKVTCKHSNRFNGPLKIFKATLYHGKEPLEIKTNPSCEFIFKDLSYSTSYQLEVVAFNGHFPSAALKETVSTHYNDKALTGFLVFLIVFTSVALLVVIYKIYTVRRKRDMSDSYPLLMANATSVEPIEADVLLEAYKRKLADEGRLFLDEFQSIPKFLTRYTVKEAKKNCNVSKNRYGDILPYDYNRVQLSTGNGEAGCDYINASFIDGYKESKKYIAAQGPKEETVCDFWRMIWEQRSTIIVMLTRCEEGNKNKCVQYWPSIDRETEIFEEFVVKLNSEDHFPDYSIRHLNLTNRKENSEREVAHIQFISWPDHGVPEDPHLLLKLRRRVNTFKNVFSGPIVIHCSAGVGRTGTYMGIDAMMECLEAEGKVDVYGYVFKLRKHRCLMVQVEAQYILIHQALLEHNQFGETEISLSELHNALNTLKENNYANEPTLLLDEFERLPTYNKWKTFNAGITEENKKKNRCSSIIPYDYNRVLLMADERWSQDSIQDEDHEGESFESEDDEETTKYINASNIHGYWGPRRLIAAQTPLVDTVADFWLMVFQKKVSTIVMLSGGNADEKESAYWDKENTFGDIEVEVTSTDVSPNVINRNMLIRHVKRKESRTVTHVQFMKWVDSELPEKAQDLTDMIKEVKRTCDCGKKQKGPPVLVHCSDGSTRCGVFCALWNLLDSAETEKVVDVFHVSRTMRKERQGMIASLEQYEFLYNALDGVYPVQNGDVKAVLASEVDSVHMVNETITAQQTEDGACTPVMDQEEAAESDALVAKEGQGEKKEAEKLSSILTETPFEDGSSREV
ncbi:receptor-type tyrosine-protein phosphatase C [Corythoichthys intestinalis]|uniref:receptor-type tyrosine-protein phosphatase C n=1 Tax=Corythoichthys intestinalis TaxID=161448 RepID=UPI0025A5EFEB|nr:receptor-type tyrosine-protein phosphatase C [Corythoichthys intestinalis]